MMHLLTVIIAECRALIVTVLWVSFVVRNRLASNCKAFIGLVDRGCLCYLNAVFSSRLRTCLQDIGQPVNSHCTGVRGRGEATWDDHRCHRGGHLLGLPSEVREASNNGKLTCGSDYG